MTTRATSTPRNAGTATGHDRSPELQRLRVCRQLRTTGGMPHVKYQWLPSPAAVVLATCLQCFGIPWALVPLKARVRNSTHPIQFGTLPKRLSLPFPDAETILPGYEEDVSSIRDGFFSLGEVGSRNHPASSHCQREGRKSCVSRGTSEEAFSI